MDNLPNKIENQQQGRVNQNEDNPQNVSSLDLQPITEIYNISTLPPEPTSSNMLSNDNASSMNVNQVQNSTSTVQNIRLEEESSTAKSESKYVSKTKISNKLLRMRRNNSVRRLVTPKSPLMVFSELFKNVPINVEKKSNSTGSKTLHTASFEVNNVRYTADHTIKLQAKQKVCENFLREMLLQKMQEPSDKKQSLEFDKEISGDDKLTQIMLKNEDPEVFPWSGFASLGMYNLLNYWEIHRGPNLMQKERDIQVPKKTVAVKSFPDNPLQYHPVQLLNELMPDIKISVSADYFNIQPYFKSSCELFGVKFTAGGKSKRAAKRFCAIKVIKYVWEFDYLLAENGKDMDRSSK